MERDVIPFETLELDVEWVRGNKTEQDAIGVARCGKSVEEWEEREFSLVPSAHLLWNTHFKYSHS